MQFRKVVKKEVSKSVTGNVISVDWVPFNRPTLFKILLEERVELKHFFVLKGVFGLGIPTCIL